MILLKTYFKHTFLFTLLFLASIGLYSQTKAKDGKEFPAPKDIKNFIETNYDYEITYRIGDIVSYKIIQRKNLEKDKTKIIDKTS